MSRGARTVCQLRGKRPAGRDSRARVRVVAARGGGRPGSADRVSAGAAGLGDGDSTGTPSRLAPGTGRCWPAISR